MAEDSEKPLYTYVPSELHDYLDEIKDTKNINKSDVVNIALELLRKYYSMDDIDKLWSEFTVIGPAGLFLPRQCGEGVKT
jgi:hypothetical protein